MSFTIETLIPSFPMQTAGLNINPADPFFSQAPISHIKEHLDRLFENEDWESWEPETISIELNMVLDGVLRDKMKVIHIVHVSPNLYFDDPAFTIYATEAINNNSPDFGFVPSPSSLEYAFAITEIQKMLSQDGKTAVFSDPIKYLIAWTLREEGYSKPVYPFEFIPQGMLQEGQTEKDTKDKEQAIKSYIKYMESL